MHPDFEEGLLHKTLFEFMSDINYHVSSLVGPCDKLPENYFKVLVSQGYEVFPHLMTTGKNECTIFMRKKKDLLT